MVDFSVKMFEHLSVCIRAFGLGFSLPISVPLLIYILYYYIYIKGKLSSPEKIENNGYMLF